MKYRLRNFNFKHYAERTLNALAATMLTAASVHMGISIIAALISRNIFYINPIEFLGLGFVLPDYLHSTYATFAAWAVLVGMFVVFFLLHAYLFVTVASKNDQLRQYVIRIGQGANQILRQMVRQQRESDSSEHE